jgi:hypothetical protein
METKEKQIEQFQVNLSLIGYHVTLENPKHNELREIIIELNRMMNSVECMENQFSKQGARYIGTDDWYRTKNLLNTQKIDLIKKITEI